ncbi:MAG: hypothetical protein QOD58_1393, partial [Mycobacterium sp.]|nr:hypothetical protein [Mycobacterium sp.]
RTAGFADFFFFDFLGASRLVGVLIATKAIPTQLLWLF